MTTFNPDDYGPIFAPILRQAPLNELGPGRPVAAMRKQLAGISLDEVFAAHRIVDPTMAQVCLAGLWLRFDFLDESHTISQSIQNATGSFWHGIMHRREPDYDNAKYWFRRVPEHPVFAPLCRAAADEIAAASEPSPRGRGQGEGAESRADTVFLQQQTQWDPFRFVDLVAKSAGSGTANEDLCRRIQQREWELLFDYCWRAAVGKSSA